MVWVLVPDVIVPLEDAVAEDPVAVEAHVAVCGRSVTCSPLQMALAKSIVSANALALLSLNGPSISLTLLISFAAVL